MSACVPLRVPVVYVTPTGRPALLVHNMIHCTVAQDNGKMLRKWQALRRSIPEMQASWIGPGCYNEAGKFGTGQIDQCRNGQIRPRIRRL